jgi:membrane-associated phospholipid phosphatase
MALGARPARADSYWRSRPESPYRLRLELDLPLLLVGLPVWLFTHEIDAALPPPSCGQPGNLCDRSQVPWFDRHLMFTNGSLKEPADFLFKWSPVIIGGLLFLDYGPHRLGSYATDAVIIVESIAWAATITHIFRYAVRRPRPYLYFDNVYPDHRNTADATMSFWSGHSSELVAFGVSTAYILTRRHKSLALRITAWSVAAALGVTEGILRVGSGDHFFSDVVIGTAVGVASGLAVPAVHPRRANGEKRVVTVTPISNPSMAGIGVSGIF